jgi:hypothetical protein
MMSCLFCFVGYVKIDLPNHNVFETRNGIVETFSMLREGCTEEVLSLMFRLIT